MTQDPLTQAVTMESTANPGIAAPQQGEGWGVFPPLSPALQAPTGASHWPNSTEALGQGPQVMQPLGHHTGQ